MAECSNCGHENPDWVPVEEFVRARTTVVAIKDAVVQMYDLAHRVLDLAGYPPVPPPPAGEVRKFRPRKRDGGQHRSDR